MNIGNNIVTHVIKTGDIAPFTGLEATDQNGFWGIDKQAWKYIKDHHQKHGVVPTEEIFRASYPEAIYTFAEKEYKASELADLANRDALRQGILSLWEDVDEDYKAGNYERALTRITAFGMSAPKSEPLFQVLTRSELEQLPDPESLIDGVLEKGTIVALSGKFGTCKSFLALDWAACIATGRKWKGHKTEQGPVLYIAAEGGFGQRDRVTAWENANECRIPDSEFHLIPKPVQLANRQHIDQLIELIATEAYDLVIVDTQSRCTVGVDENSAKDMGQVLDNVYRLRDAVEEAGTTVILVHHLGKNAAAGGRGSTVIESGVDSAYSTIRSNGIVTLSCVKRKDGPDDLNMSFRLIPSGPSMVLDDSLPDVDGGDRRTVLNLISQNPDITLTKLAELSGISRTTLNRRLGEYEAEGLVTRTKGASSKQPDLWNVVSHF